ncbi:phosphotransferase enzyme family protein [Ktedonospora formicarum]|uniref:Aminoglycoside phosphotransferase domain-containing protein n=1 Tax=Ktedonospora formicarum TaxID=2778364 RepID=A0A8J3I6M1_9CHLR|nr:phosphotransferase [Ktedonospora formicarum]GHO45669.1 hypothetical protein KSX_38320 [Ktedonospora formicarum]
MHSDLAQKLCNAYHLGDSLVPPRAVKGGLLHKMWQLETTQGRYAVKQLNPAIMLKPGIEHAYRASERIASEMRRRDIPAIAALERAGDPLYQDDDGSFLIYPWREGRMLSTNSAEPEQARQIGAILASMHAAALRLPEDQEEEWEHFSDDTWDKLTFHAASRDLSWAYSARAAMPRLIAWSHLYEEAGPTLLQRQVVSHRDLDQKNVLWHVSGTPFLLDWEAAGSINPTLELVGVALCWSGLVAGEVRKESFDAVLEGYHRTGGVLHEDSEIALHGFLGTWLGWLLFNMRRSLGESVESEDARLLGEREVGSTLKLLHAFNTQMPTWASLIDAWR